MDFHRVLHKSFLQTIFKDRRTKIDVHLGTLSMEFDDIVMRFNILDAMKHPSKDHYVFHVDIIDDVVNRLEELHFLNALKHSSISELSEFACIDSDCESNSDYDVDDDAEFVEFDSLGDVPTDFDVIQSECTNNVTGSTNAFDSHVEVQVVESISPSPEVPATQLAPNTPELKPPQNNLKYVYLEKEEKLPVIISTSHTTKLEQRLLHVLKKHKKAIGWTFADIPDNSPSTCMHMILLEGGAKPLRQPQRQLNLVISDVIKKEVTKLLQAGIIYRISDN